MVALGTCDALPASSRRLEFPSDEREEEDLDGPSVAQSGNQGEGKGHEDGQAEGGKIS